MNFFVAPPKLSKQLLQKPEKAVLNCKGYRKKRLLVALGEAKDLC